METSGISRIATILILGTVILIWVPMGLVFESFRRWCRMPLFPRLGIEPPSVVVSTKVNEGL